MTIVLHVANTTPILQGEIIDIFIACENVTVQYPLLSYITTEFDGSKEWLELSLNMTAMPCSPSEMHVFFVRVTGNCSSIDALLVVYDYRPHGGIDLERFSSFNKRSTLNNTLLSVYQDAGVNCSVQSVFLNYRHEFPVFDESTTVISPNSVGINMTFCYGVCDELSHLTSLNMSSTTRRHFISDISHDMNSPIPKSCCIPDIIEHESMIVAKKDVLTMEAFPQVVKCHCVI